MPKHQMIDIPEVDFMAVSENVSEWRIGERVVFQRPRCLWGWGLGVVFVVPLVIWLIYHLISNPLDEIFHTLIWSGGIIGGLCIYYLSPMNSSNRRRETTIDWEARTIKIKDGFQSRVRSLDAIRRICLQTTATTGQPPAYQGVIKVDIAGKQFPLFETLLSQEDKDQPCEYLLALARRLAEAFDVPCEVYFESQLVEEKDLAGCGSTNVEIAKKYEDLGSFASGSAMSADFRGKAYEAEEHRQEAIFYYMQAHKLAPSLPEPLLKIGRLLNNDKQSEVILEAALQLNPDNVAALLEQAHKLDIEGRFEEALEIYTQAVEKEPSTSTYEARAFAYQYHNRFDSAYADFSEVILLDPQDADGYSNRADCLRKWYENTKKADLIEQALADYAEAIRLDPEDSSFLTERGVLFKAAGRTAEAIADFTQAIKQEPESYYALSQRGQAYLDCGDKAREAERDFCRMIEILERQPKTTDSTMSECQNMSIAAAYRWRAEARRLLGQLEQADSDQQHAVALAGEMME